jgi:hypothetical protein
MQVSREEVLKFAHVWTHKGVAIPMKDVHIDFTRDFANVVLRNFIAMVQADSAKKRQQEEAKKLVLTDPT